MVSGEDFDLSAHWAREWDDLARHLGAPAYSRPGWLGAWRRAFRTEGVEMHVARRGGELVGVLPVVRRGGAVAGAWNIHSPGFGMVADGAATADGLADVLFSRAPRHVSLVGLDAGGETFRAVLHAAHNRGYRVLIRRYCCSPYLDYDRSWEEYESGLDHKLLSNLRRRQRNLEKEGRLRFEITGGKARLDSLLQEVYEVEASGWKGRRGSAIISDARTLDFYTELARWAATAGLLRLAFLRLDGRAIASCYQIVQDGVCHSLKIGYLEEFGRYAPGMLLLHKIIRHDFEAGLARMNFGGGGDGYKFAWTQTAEEHLRVEAFAPTARGGMALAAFVYARPLIVRIPAIGRWRERISGRAFL